ncbi:MAG: DNA cytosine methyltransferase, partial [Sodaliphilus sp.]|nr:DNA cytosine methyltransferase [Sodaliphilus sp.]
MSLNIIVLAKQVPDTRNVGKDAMKADGTINRAALPAIFNPEDLNALEQALRLKEQHPGSTIGMLTMGPPRAGEIIRQGLYRGADTGWLLTDRLFAGADTLATSYALATAIKKISAEKPVDIVIGGPPCQGFSNANRQHTTVISMNNRLVKEYVRAICELNPKAFV